MEGLESAMKELQLSLFPKLLPHSMQAIPLAVQQALSNGAALAISVSGGKDSDAMLRHLTALHRAQRWPGPLFAITADLGRIEWPGTFEHIQMVCSQLNVKLVIVRRRKGGMIERWDERRQVLIEQQELAAIALGEEEAIAPEREGDKPFWSSSAARYCTKELKTAEVDRYLRRFGSVVCAVGIRAEESSSRAKKPHCQVRNDITTASLKAPRGLNAKEHEQWAEEAIARWEGSDHTGRLALTWNAILDWPLEKVWETIGTSEDDLERRRSLYRSKDITAALKGWPGHWAYVSGNSRLSCSMCVLASAADIRNGAEHNPSTWLELATMEVQSGWSFQQGKWLSDLNVGLEDRMETTEKLFADLKALGLIEQWNPMFVIALLSVVPVLVIACWKKRVQLALAAAVQRQMETQL